MPKPVTLRRIALVALFAALPASAIELDYSIRGAAGYSSNINQSTTDPTGSGLLIPQLDFRWKEQGSTLQASAIGELQYFDYLNGSFSNQLLGALSGILDWAVIPQRLHLVVEDDASVQPVNVLEPNAPSNLQQVNVLSVGPTLQFRLGAPLSGEVDFRVLNSTASKTSDFDSLREVATVRAIRHLAPTRELSANVDGEHVHFTGSNPSGPDYNRYSAYGRYQSRLAHLDLDLSLGYSRLSLPGFGSRSAPLGRGTGAWRATPRSTFGLGFMHGYSDAAQDLASLIDFTSIEKLNNGILVGTATISSEVYLESRVDVSYGFDGTRVGLHVNPYWRKLAYVSAADLDQTAHGGGFDLSYRLRPRWTIGLLASEETRRYTTLARRDEDIRLGLYLLQQLSRHWSWRLDLTRNERHSTAALQGFRENIGLVTLIFTR